MTSDIYYQPANIELVSVNVDFKNITPALPGYGICGFHESGYVALVINSTNRTFTFTALTWSGRYLASLVQDIGTIGNPIQAQVTATYKNGVFYGSVAIPTSTAGISGYDFVNNYMIFGLNNAAGYTLLFNNYGSNYACASVYKGVPCLFCRLPYNSDTACVNYLTQQNFTLGKVFSPYANCNTNFEVNYATGEKSSNQLRPNAFAIGDVTLSFAFLYVGSTQYGIPTNFSSLLYNGRLLLTGFSTDYTYTEVTTPMVVYDTGVLVNLNYTPLQYLTNFSRNYSMPVMVKGGEHLTTLPKNTNISFHLKAR